MLAARSLFFASAFALIVFSRAESALIYIDFSGGDGSPMSLTFSSELHLRATSGGGMEGLCLVFDETGNVLQDGNGLNFPGSVSVNSTPYGDIVLYSDVDAGDITSTDLYFIIQDFSSTLISSGDEVLLSAGTYTSDVATPWIVPADGFYDYFLTDGAGDLISTTPVPEPSCVAALAGLAAIGSVVIIRRNRSVAKA